MICHILSMFLTFSPSWRCSYNNNILINLRYAHTHTIHYRIKWDRWNEICVNRFPWVKNKKIKTKYRPVNGQQSFLWKIRFFKKRTKKHFFFFFWIETIIFQVFVTNGWNWKPLKLSNIFTSGIHKIGVIITFLWIIYNIIIICFKK